MYDQDITIGNPLEQLSYWEHQQEGDNCAVVAEMSIINQFGHDLSQESANFISASNGWYQPGGGTSPEHIGNMMELFGIDSHSNYNASISDLAQELHAGNGVIVGVNANELWDQGPLADLYNFLIDALDLDRAEYIPANHAVVVTGIDTSDPSNPMVIINDSGFPDGAGNMYPLDKFMDAWENSNFYYTATDSPLPSGYGNSAEEIDWTPWIGLGTGIVAGAVSFSVTGDVLSSCEIGMDSARYVIDYFNDPNAIVNI